MSTGNTGGPAFPTDCNKNIIYGMALRDYFAAKAIASFIFAGSDYERAAFEAYKQADAMLEARKS